MKSLILAAVLLAQPLPGHAQPCLVNAVSYLDRICPSPSGWQDADSTLIDSCSESPDPCHNLALYAKRGFQLSLDRDIFGLPKFAEDTVIELSWRRIDSSQGFIRNVLDSLEQRTGQFLLRKLYPAQIGNEPLAGRFAIDFDQPVQVSDVDYWLTFNNLKFQYRGGPSVFSAITSSDLHPSVRINSNLTQGMLMIDGLNSPCWLEVFNSLGQKVMSFFCASSFQTLDWSHEPKGLYYIKINQSFYAFIKR